MPVPGYGSAMRMYAELAPWFHYITHPDEYATEAAQVARIPAPHGWI